MKRMAKSMRIQVLIEPELLNKVKTYADDSKILYKNDSQLIRNILYSEISKLRDQDLTIYIIRNQLEESKKNVADLMNQINASTIRCTDLSKENEILNKNLKKKVKKK